MEDDARIFSVIGGARRCGRWRVPASTQTLTLFGRCVIDLRQAETTAEEIEFTCLSVFASVTFIVPAGAEIRPSGMAILGSARSLVPVSDVPSHLPPISIDATTVIGRFRIRTTEEEPDSEKSSRQIRRERKRAEKLHRKTKGRSRSKRADAVDGDEADDLVTAPVPQPDPYAYRPVEPAYGGVDIAERPRVDSIGERLAPRDPAPAGIGFEDLTPPLRPAAGIGFEDLAPAPSAGIGFEDLTPGPTAGIGFEDLTPAPSAGIGFEDLTPAPSAGIGFEDLTPAPSAGIGFEDLAPAPSVGIGFEDLTPGPSAGIGFEDLTPGPTAGIGFEDLTPGPAAGIGFEDLPPADPLPPGTIDEIPAPFDPGFDDRSPLTDLQVPDSAEQLDADRAES